jgi:hypothetical protein
VNRTARNIFAFIAALLIVAAVPVVALATDVSVTADRTEVKAGDTVTLTVIVTADHIGVASGSFTYDPALLTYAGSDGGASDGYINIVSAQKGGASSLTAVIKFTAKAKGTAAVNVSIDNVLSYDEQTLEKAEGKVSITIAASDAPPQTTGGESKPAVDLSQTGVKAQNVTDAKAQMYVWRDLSSLTLPSGFADKQVTYAGEQVGGAAVGDDMILLYLSEAAGENAGYYMYNEQKNTLDPYITITSKRAGFTILWPDQTLAAPEGFEKTTLEWDDRSLPAWKARESGDIVYLVYARNSKGEAGFYLFNTEDESVQRYAAVPEQGTAPAESTTEPTAKPVAGPVPEANDPSGITIDRTLFIALCAAAALILAAAAVFAALYMRREHGKLRRVVRMKERMEAEARERQVHVATPAPAPPEPKGKQASLVKDADLSNYSKSKDT